MARDGELLRRARRARAGARRADPDHRLHAEDGHQADGERPFLGHRRCAFVREEL